MPVLPALHCCRRRLLIVGTDPFRLPAAVGILVDRSPAVVIGMFGVLKVRSLSGSLRLRLG